GSTSARPAAERGRVRRLCGLPHGGGAADPVALPRSPPEPAESDVRFVELDGVVPADAPGCVKLFETGLPTRYYLDLTHVDRARLRRSDTVTRCPYKGTTTSYWSFDSDVATHQDIAWAYDFPTAHVNRIAGLVAFYDERVDLYVDRVKLPRPPDRTR
ncbi:DUF427 domain-containing protein, partial [Streptomyces sp. NPDC060030]|uniref:DUF427 domain-containing protein n=1 Tax=Streptomyces sp. NPDC060030 TaxID=3347042 RepID=UPI00369669D6